VPSEQIQWFPGHMAKTRRLIKENLRHVDIVIEILDARIPQSSANPELPKLIGDKPLLKVLSKTGLADPAVTSMWKSSYAASGRACTFTDCMTGYGMNGIYDAVCGVLEEKMERLRGKGMTGYKPKAMVVGIPNVGKSTFINKLAGSKKAAAEDRPGVTTNKQWISTSAGLDLLDTPGVLWPKFEDRIVGENLAATGAVNDKVYDMEAVAIALCGRLRKSYPELLSTRYKLGEIPPSDQLEDYLLFEEIGRKRGFLMRGGEVDYTKTSVILLDEFRGGKIGRISLERPEARG